MALHYDGGVHLRVTNERVAFLSFHSDVALTHSDDGAFNVTRGWRSTNDSVAFIHDASIQGFMPSFHPTATD